MEAKLNFLIDQSQPFTIEKVQILDQLTNSMKINAPDVKFIINIYRPNKPIKYGGFSNKITFSGLIREWSYQMHKYTKLKYTC